MFNKIFKKEESIENNKKISQVPSASNPEELEKFLLENGMSSEALSKIDLSKVQVMSFDNKEEAMKVAAQIQNKLDE